MSIPGGSASVGPANINTAKRAAASAVNSAAAIARPRVPLSSAAGEGLVMRSVPRALRRPGRGFPRAAEGLGPRIKAIALLTDLYAGRLKAASVK
jgi:hypothetical protein